MECPTGFEPAKNGFAIRYLTIQSQTQLNLNYLNGGPKNQTTNEYLIPFVTGATLCSISEGNTIIDPILLNSGVTILHFSWV